MTSDSACVPSRVLTQTILVVGLTLLMVLSSVWTGSAQGVTAQPKKTLKPKIASTGTTNRLAVSAFKAHQTNVQLRLLRQRTFIPKGPPVVRSNGYRPSLSRTR